MAYETGLVQPGTSFKVELRAAFWEGISEAVGGSETEEAVPS